MYKGMGSRGWRVLTAVLLRRIKLNYYFLFSKSDLHILNNTVVYKTNFIYVNFC